MADLEKTVSIIFSGVDQLSGTVKSLEKQVSGFAGGIESATAPLASMADTVLKTEAALVALSVGGMALAVATAGKFGDSFNEISTLIDDSDKNIGNFRDSILDYAGTSTASLESINGAVYSAISAGTEYSKSLDLISTAEKLSVAGKADLNDTTVLLASTLNAYGETTAEAARYSDVFFQTVKLGQTTIPELSSNLSKVTGIAASAGVPIETLTAAIAALTAAGNPTSESITSIKAAISNIIKPSASAAELAGELGIQFNATALKTKGLEGVLKDAARATGGSTEKLAQLFGSTEALNAVLTLTSEKTGPKFDAALESMRNSAGATAAAFEKMENNLSVSNQKIVNSLQTALIEAGEPLLDDYSNIADGIAAIFNGVRVSFSDGAFDEVFDVLDNFSEDAKKFLLEVAKALPEAFDGLDFRGLIASFDNLGGSLKGAFEAFFGDIDLTTAEGLESALQKVVDAFAALTNVSAGVIEGLQPLFSTISAGIDAFSDMDGGAQALTGNILGLGKSINTFITALQVLGPILSVLAGSSMINAVKNVASLGVSATALAPKLSGLAATIGGIVTSPVGLVGLAGASGVAVGSLARMIPGIDEAAQSFAEFTDKLFNWTGTAWDSTEASDQLVETVKKIPEEVQDAVDDIGEIEFEGVKITASGPDAQEVQGIIDGTTKVAREAKEVIEIEIGGEKKEYIIYTYPDDESIDETKSELDKLTKDQNVKIEYDKERLKVEAETAQKAMEFAVKINTVEAETDLKRFQTVADGIGKTFESTGTVISGALGLMLEAEKAGGLTGQIIRRQIENEEKRRQGSYEIQTRLAEAQLEYLHEKTLRLGDKDSLIEISADGLEPELEAFMWRIIERVQIRASEVQAEFLLGIS